ncbi:MAG: transglutaminase-like domain-containing protein [Bacillota bacterium]
MHNNDYLKETSLLNFNHNAIKTLIKTSGWSRLDPYKQIDAAYTYVRDNIRFGYSKEDALKASDVLISGIGQCNTKGTLLMALLRGLNIPCKIEGFHVDASFQKQLLPPILRLLGPKRFLHSKIHVYYDGNYIPLEGYVLDRDYLTGLKNMLPNHQGPLYSYAVATKDFNDLHIDWQGKETFIQKDAIVQSLGTYKDPDSLFDNHYQPFSKVKKVIYKNGVRHLMNLRVNRIRRQKEKR